MLGKTDRRRKKGGDCFRFLRQQVGSDTLLSKVEESESEVWIRARSSEALFVISVKSEAPSFNCVKRADTEDPVLPRLPAKFSS